MAEHGLKVRDAGGRVILNTSDMVSRVRYYSVVTAGVSSNTTLSDIVGKTTYAVSIPLQGGLAHSVTISGTTFSWTAQSTARQNSSNSLVLVIMVD